MTRIPFPRLGNAVIFGDRLRGATCSLALSMTLACSGSDDPLPSSNGGAGGLAQAGAAGLGGSSSSGNTGHSGGSSSGAGGSSSRAGNGGSSAGNGGSSAGNGAAGTGTGGAGQQGPASLLPLAVGNSWTYQVTELRAQPTCPAGTRMQVMVRAEQYQGKNAFAQSSFCDGDIAYLSSATDEIQQYQGGAWVTSFHAPLADGQQWDYMPGVSFKWHVVGSVTVAAGTFSQCWERIPPSSIYPTPTYCVGVGLVRQSDATYLAELTAYSLK